MEYSDHKYINNELERVQKSAKDSLYPATIIIAHEGTKTKTLNINSDQLNQIRKILLSPDETLIL